MESLISLLTTLNSLSPLAVIALLATIIYKQVKDKPATEASVDEIKHNHLHDLPEILATLQRIESKLSEEFGYIKGRLNGKGQ
jgi:hypothetical protein